MKNYAQITSTYLSANGFIRCYIKDACGAPVQHLLTEKQVKAYSAKGVTVTTHRI